MKKAKIMLMSIAIVGVLGGAFAFKAAKFTSPNVATCKTTAVGGPAFCSLIPYATTPNGTGVTFRSIFINATAPVNTVCSSTASNVNCNSANAIPTTQSVYFNN